MFTFSVPTTALFGAGKLNELHGQINTPMGAVHGTKALVVISNGKSTRANGYLNRLENELKQAGVEYVVFDKFSANPTKPVVKDCGVADLKMSDYGIDPSEFPKMVQNARDTLGPNFQNDPCPLSDEDCVSIYQKSYR